MAGFLEKYHLDKSSKKFPCPQCGKREFVVYIDAETKVPVNEHAFGRCDRQNNCGYHVKPDAKKKDDAETYVVSQVFPPESEFNKLTRTETNFHRYMKKVLDIDPEKLYDLGILADGALTVFVYRNAQGRVSNLKWFKYLEDGHRDKNFESRSLPQPKRRNKYIEEKYFMCLFLEHLLDPDKKKTVCVVESEKTAAICRFIYPQYDWVGCGSATGLSDGSNDTADKITPLKGRRVYWIRDSDKAARPTLKDNQHGEAISVPVSSERNLDRYIEDWHILDLWPDRSDKYDIGDAVLEGKKPELVPSWSKIPPDPRAQAYLPPDVDIMLYEFEHGKEIGETSNVAALNDIFSWMRGFINCWTGWPNDGKSTFFMFMALLKSVLDGWKWCIWPPEMVTSTRDLKTKRVRISARDIYDELIFMLTGKCPYKHWEKKYGVPQMARSEYLDALNWIARHFFIVYPKSRKPEDLLSVFRYQYEINGIDGTLADPFKNFQHDEGGRTDTYLDETFAMFKEVALETNTSSNIIAHPKSQSEPKDLKTGAYKICTPHMLAGGASWHNNMDGIFTPYRPNRHTNIKDPTVHFYTLKQRKQELVGTVGAFKDIKFDFFGHRFYFNDVCPIDGTQMPDRGGNNARNGVIPFDDRKRIAQAPIEFKTTVIPGYDPSQPSFGPDADETPF